MPQKRQKKSRKSILEPVKEETTDQPAELGKGKGDRQKPGNANKAKWNGPGDTSSSAQNGHNAPPGTMAASGETPSGRAPAPKETQSLKNASLEARKLKQLAKALLSDEKKTQLKNVNTLKRKVSTIQQLPVGFIVETGLFPNCVELIKDKLNEELQCEAVCLLHQLQERDERLAQVAVDAGAMDPLYDLLESHNLSSVQTAVQVYGHIAQNVPSLPCVKKCNLIVKSLAALLKPTNSVNLLVSVAWSLANLFDSHGKLLSRRAIKKCTSALVSIIRLTDEDTLAEACRALFSLSHSCKGNLKYAVDKIHESGAVPRLLAQLNSGDEDVIAPCLQAMAYFVNSSKLRTQYAVGAGLLPSLANLLKSTNSNIVWRAAWTVRNIATPTNDQTMTLVRAGFVPLLVDVVNTGSLDARKQAMYALGCIAEEAEDSDPITALCEAQGLRAFNNMLLLTDTDALVTSLDTIYDTLKSATKYGSDKKVSVALTECGGLEIIRRLQYDEKNGEVCGKAKRIMGTFFPRFAI